MIKVNNMVSNRSGRNVPNQFIIKDQENRKAYFQSYNSLIAIWDYELQQLTLGKHFNYSVTTVKYLHDFINEYCDYTTTSGIDAAPGSGYAKRLQYCIDTGIIEYNANMV